MSAQAIYVAENPRLGQASLPGREKRRPVIGQEVAGGPESEDAPAVMAGVPQADRGTVTFNDQVQDLVVEVRERGPDLVTVAAETVPAGDLVSQRAPEDNRSSSRLVTAASSHEFHARA